MHWCTEKILLRWNKDVKSERTWSEDFPHFAILSRLIFPQLLGWIKCVNHRGQRWNACKRIVMRLRVGDWFLCAEEQNLTVLCINVELWGYLGWAECWRCDPSCYQARIDDRGGLKDGGLQPLFGSPQGGGLVSLEVLCSWPLKNPVYLRPWRPRSQGDTHSHKTVSCDDFLQGFIHSRLQKK